MKTHSFHVKPAHDLLRNYNTNEHARGVSTRCWPPKTQDTSVLDAASLFTVTAYFSRALFRTVRDHNQTRPPNRVRSSGVHEHLTRHATGHVPEAQCAFKILMIHEVLQFALRIAFRCVLHRCGSLDIHR